MRPLARGSVTSTPLADEMSLTEALECARNGDRQGFTKLYTHYQELYGRHLFHLVGDLEVARDLYQEAFVRLWKELAAKQPIPNFEAWLHVVTKNLAIDYLRRSKHLTFRPLPESDSDDPEEYVLFGRISTPGHEVFVIEMDCLIQALAKMSQQYKVCLLLQEVWGLSQREIAKTLGISESAVSANVSRGMRQIRTMYKHMMDDPDATKEGGQIKC